MSVLSDFWRRHPALLIGLLALLSTASAIALHLIYPLLLFGLLLPLIMKKQYQFLLTALASSLLIFALTSLRTRSLPTLTTAIQGKGTFHITNLCIHHSPFNRCYFYKGILKSFQTEQNCYTNLPCSIFYPLTDPPLADRDYHIEGTLLQKRAHVYILKPNKKAPWKSIPDTFSFAAWRFNAKKNVASYIKRHILDSPSAHFLSALVTGDIDERSLRLDFNRLGLQHLLSISGFHFSLVALFINILLRPLFNFKMRTLLLLSLLGAYFFFIGNAPSILRAFTTISLFLIAPLISRRFSALNALGIALLVELLLDPFTITTFSFQFSFTCTLALLLFFPCMHHLFCLLLPQRSYATLQQMPFLDRHGYILSSLLRSSLTVNCAVHLFSLPLFLHLFHRFPLLSLIYNLFFPFCITLSLILLACASLTALLLPPLSSLLHTINSKWTAALLHLTCNPPVYFDFVLRTKLFTFSLTLFTLFCLMHLGIITWMRLKTEN